MKISFITTKTDNNYEIIASDHTSFVSCDFIV